MSKSNNNDHLSALEQNLHTGATENNENGEWSMFDSALFNLTTQERAILESFEDLPAPGERAALLAHVFKQLDKDKQEGVLGVVREHLNCYHQFVAV